jgi:rubrerythrin
MPTRLDFSQLSLMDALDLATLIEVEACKRYNQFAERLGTGWGDDAASFFQSMAVNESKHGEEITQRRVKLFGEQRPNVKLDDIFDVEAPEFGAVRRDMSVLEAYQVALSAEKKAWDFYDRSLRHVTHPEIKALFEELREEEDEHVRMIEELIAKLPPSAREEPEDQDDLPDSYTRKLAKDRYE